MEDGVRQETHRPEVLSRNGLQECGKIIKALLRDMDVIWADDTVGIVGAVEGEAGPLVEGDD